MLLLLMVAHLASSQRSVIGFDSEGRITIQGDNSRLGQRGGVSSEAVPEDRQEFLPTLSGRGKEVQVEGRSGVHTQSLTLNRLSGGPVSITIERQAARTQVRLHSPTPTTVFRFWEECWWPINKLLGLLVLLGKASFEPSVCTWQCTLILLILLPCVWFLLPPLLL